MSAKTLDNETRRRYVTSLMGLRRLEAMTTSNLDQPLAYGHAPRPRVQVDMTAAQGKYLADPQELHDQGRLRFASPPAATAAAGTRRIPLLPNT